jgi:hypothetical protein
MRFGGASTTAAVVRSRAPLNSSELAAGKSFGACFQCVVTEHASVRFGDIFHLGRRVSHSDILRRGVGRLGFPAFQSGPACYGVPGMAHTACGGRSGPDRRTNMRI